MKIILTLITAFFASLLIATQLDEELNPEAIQLMDRLDKSSTSEAYLYLLGIDAASDAPPIEAGQRILNEYHNSMADKSSPNNAIAPSDTLSLPEGDLFCRISEQGCLQALFALPINIEPLRSQHSTIIQRVNRFYQFNEFTTLAKPSENEPIPKYPFIAKVERIKILEAISAYHQGKHKEAIESLLDRVPVLRQTLALQDNLIGKLVFINMLSDVLDVASAILSKEDVKVEAIARLTPGEKDFSIAAAREFALNFHMYQKLDRHPEFFNQGGNTPGWFVRMVYKPNMTVNAVAPIYTRLARLAQLPPMAFAQQVENNKPPVLSTSKLRNYVGDILAAFTPSVDKYAGRMMNLDTKIELFNQIHVAKLNLSEIKNPFYKNATAERRGHYACFDGPFEDERKLRCLRLTWAVEKD